MSASCANNLMKKPKYIKEFKVASVSDNPLQDGILTWAGLGVEIPRELGKAPEPVVGEVWA